MADPAVQALDPLAHLDDIAGQVNVDSETVQMARAVIQAGKDEHIHVGRDPAGVAAGAVVAVAEANGEEFQITEWANRIPVSYITLRKRADELERYLPAREP